MIEQYCYCACGRILKLRIYRTGCAWRAWSRDPSGPTRRGLVRVPRPDGDDRLLRDHYYDMVRRAGWVLSEPIGSHGRMTFCSVACPNVRTQDDHDRRDVRHARWWAWMKKPGLPPPCTCALATRPDGLLHVQEDPACPWEVDVREHIRMGAQVARELYARWYLIPVGTRVHEIESDLLFHASRGHGRTTGPPRLHEYDTGTCSVWIPVAWDRGTSDNPLARLEDLEIVSDGDDVRAKERPIPPSASGDQGVGDVG